MRLERRPAPPSDKFELRFDSYVSEANTATSPIRSPGTGCGGIRARLCPSAPSCVAAGGIWFYVWIYPLTTPKRTRVHIDRFPRLRLAHLPTPLEPMPALSRALGGPDLWIKRDDCTGLATGGNKSRKLELLMADAI